MGDGGARARLMQVPATCLVGASDALRDDGFGDSEVVVEEVVKAAEAVGQWMFSSGGLYYAPGAVAC